MNNNFDNNKTKDSIIAWIRQWFEENAKGQKAIIAVSGGRDSAIATALFVEALGKDEVIAIILPYDYSTSIDDTVTLLEYLDVEFHVLYIRHAYKELESEVFSEIGPLTKGAMANMQERIRIAALKGIAINRNGISVNTSSYTDDWLGYYTKYGDISPFLNMTITEVKELGKALQLPSYYIEDLPSDGLFGFIDENEIGFSYEELDDYLRGVSEPSPEIKERLDLQHNKTRLRREDVDVYKFTIEDKD